MLTRFKKLQEAIKAESDRYNMDFLRFEEEDYIKVGCKVWIIGVSLKDNKVMIEVSDKYGAEGTLGMSWLSDLCIAKVVETMTKYV